MLTQTNGLAVRVKNLWNVQILRFFIMGGVNVIFSYSIFAFLIFINLHYSLACFFGTILSILFNFKITGSIVFRNMDNTLFFKYIGVYVIVFVLNVIGLKILHSFGINSYIAGAMLILPLSLVAYVLNKSFVFK
jgi:putative flippase GtrA